MPTSTLNLTVRTIDDRVLLPHGSEFSKGALNALISSHETGASQSFSLMRYGTVKEDLQGFLSVQPYQAIFPRRKEVTDLLGEMDVVQLAAPVLKSLDYFKERDFYSYRHFLTVFAISTLLGKDLVHDGGMLADLAATGPTHDIGKICVPLRILKKTTPLTKAEKRSLDDHSYAGYALLSYYLRDTEALAGMVARDHHERSDGSGYPCGIRLADPMVEIVAVSDIYDALISPRPYRKTGYDNRTALEEITSMAEENKLSWDVVRALVAHNRASKPHYSDVTISSLKRGTPPPDNLHGVVVDEENPGD